MGIGIINKNMHKQKVLIVGGGFAGVKTALELSGDEKYAITLLSDQTHLRYYPALYHTATGGSRAEASIPLVDIFEDKNIQIVKGAAETLDRERQIIKTKSNERLPYDILILALGVVTNYFGIKGLREHSFGIKSVEDAEELKQHLHDQLMQDGKPDFNYIVVGGGTTGVELAGAMAFYLKDLIKRHSVPARKVHIDIVEAGPRLVPRMPKDISRMIARRLRKLGIKLYLNKSVKGATANELMVGDKPLRSHTVVWTAGVTNNSFFTKNNFSLTEHGKVNINQFLQAEPNIYVLGDNADTPFSGLAQTALYDGEFVAKHLKTVAEGKSPKTYKPKQPVYVIPVGNNWAAVLWGKVRFYGLVGWVLRRLADLIGFHDLEPWHEALQQWMTDDDDQESCARCLAINSK